MVHRFIRHWFISWYDAENHSMLICASVAKSLLKYNHKALCNGLVVLIFVSNFGVAIIGLDKISL